ncbi:tetratricopeptide [Colletotrichum higginsianum]|uniref:Tetratricopeptide n=2 Tax=Colletotrichum higginsianum TaxID=80884 RepID=H1V3H8_COLHI|nr:Tetratricopeptide [Colletotrichum higginsianum IMI 349063]OBR13543.1 Tetratricopeptide [Colletotrichum higginsianum IMI 349063]TID01406.1 Protein bimA [Colletotrichum higginsianum]CCF34780.1 tetratricopeptide [Colletotrichum higginsianum]
MAPTSAAITGLLRQVVYYHVDNNAYESALFFAERLSAQDPKSSESAHLLSLCHLRLGDHRTAFEVSRPSASRGSNLGAAWVFAHACMKMERYKDGINALEKAREKWAGKMNLGKHTTSTRSLYPDEAAVLCLLGKLYRAFDDKRRAIECFENAVRVNPFMWDAFQALCDMGVKLRVPNIFQVTDPLVHSFESEVATPSYESKDGTANSFEPKRPSVRPPMDSSDPFNLHRSSTYQDMPYSANMFSAEAEENDFMSKITAARSRLAPPATSNGDLDLLETPTGPVSMPEVPTVRSTLGVAEPPQAPPRRTRTAQAVDPGFLEAPPKMSYKLGGAKRSTRSQDKEQQQSVELHSDTGTGTGALRSTVAPTERKRTVSGHPVSRQLSEEASAPTQRRSARLNMFNKPSIMKSNSGAATIGATAGRELKKARPQISRIMRPGSSGSSVGRVVSGNRKPVEDNGMDVDHAESARVRDSHAVQHAAPKGAPPEPDHARIEEALRWVMELMKKFASGYYSFKAFRCQEALQTYASLPRSQQDTPWVLAQMGRAHHEQAAYQDAEKYFRKLRVLAPTRMEDMEIYSTILWHLKRETDLSFLAHELVDADWTSPQAWCALGNAWSLAREHELALRCFKRATQLNPKFAYAFTLQGHEHVANEEYEKALGAFRKAVAADRRHYNAYYGIGQVFEKLGNHEKAYVHFHTASDINPNNAILICRIGVILEGQKQMMAALQFYSKATDLAPRATVVRYKKARALMSLGKIDLAEKELLILKDTAPNEAMVHFLLGKLYRNINEKQMAVRAFSNALALDPKASQSIKDAIESLEDDMGIEDSMMT